MMTELCGCGMPGEYVRVATGEKVCPSCITTRHADGVRLLAHIPSVAHVVSDAAGPAHYTFKESQPRCNVWQYSAADVTFVFNAPHPPGGSGTPVSWLVAARVRAQA